jgi:hypothetical protein
MGWSLGYDESWSRDVGYGVPSICDQPECGAKIDRGLSYACGGEPFGGEFGCGLFFCLDHIYDCAGKTNVCARCAAGQPPYDPKPDTREWIEWKLTDESWAQWRMQNPDEVERLRAA